MATRGDEKTSQINLYEAECMGTSPPPKKRAQHPRSGGRYYGFENTLTEVIQDVSDICTKLSETLREGAAEEPRKIGGMEDLLMEARSFESQLKEKKEHLRSSLTTFSDKLQG